MSGSVFQSVIMQLKENSDRTFGVMDAEGCVISSTDLSLLGERWVDAALKVSGAGESVVTFGQKSFRGILSSTNQLEYAVFCTGDDELSRTYCSLAYVALNNANKYHSWDILSFHSVLTRTAMI